MTCCHFNLLWISQFSAAIAIIVLAYIIVSLAGFGSALVAAPLLVHLMPISTVIPLLAVLDFIASILRGIHLKREIARHEIVALMPAMLAGNAIGAALIFTLSPHILLLMLGIFVVGYAVYAMSGFQSPKPISRACAMPYGVMGGVCSALFGSGGFLYALYLNKRLPSTQAIRATQSALISFSTLIRVTVFVFTGVYYSAQFWRWIVLLAPAMLLGEFLGHRISLRLSIHHFKTILHSLLLVSGASLILRYGLLAGY